MKARFLTTVNVRAGPSTSTQVVAQYCNGDTVNYDKTVENEGRLWISYIARSGNRRYCCARDNNGQWYIELNGGSGGGVGGGGGDGGGTRILASVFNDRTGCRSNNLYDGGMYYAELSNNPSQRDYKALGGLPFGHKLRITYNWKSVIASKGDVGAGGRNHPKIDLHINLARALGFNNGLDYVTIQPA